LPQDDVAIGKLPGFSRCIIGSIASKLGVLEAVLMGEKALARLSGQVPLKKMFLHATQHRE